MKSLLKKYYWSDIRMKRFQLIQFALLLCFLSVQAMAQVGPSVIVSSESGNVGQAAPVDITITYTAESTVVAYQLAISYDSTNLTPDLSYCDPGPGATSSALDLVYCSEPVAGTINVIVENATGVFAIADQLAFSLPFDISAAPASPPSYDLTIVSEKYVNAQAGEVPTGGSTSGQITISKADQVITNFMADPPNGLVGGSSTLSATASSGLPVTFGSSTTAVCTVAGNVVSYLTVGICTVTADQAGDASYNAAPQVTLDITGDKVDQAITGFAANPSPGVVNGTSVLSATASSGLPVTFGSNTTAVCTVAGDTVSYIAAGTCTVTADQAGNAAYNPAPQETLSITVNKVDQTITGLAANPDPGVVDGTSTLSATASSGLDVTFGSSTPAVCSVAGSTVTYLAAGTCTVTADQAGDDDYNAATQVTLGITVNPADQTITGLAADPASGQVSGTSALSATASSGLAVTFASSTTAVCTVAGSTVTYVAVGTCTVTADQAGDANYNAAPQVSIDITVAKGDQAITNFVADPPVGSIGLTSTLSATGGNSGNPVTFGSLTPDMCTVSGSTVTFVLNGPCTVTADQEGDDDYNAAPQATLVISVAATAIPTLSQWGLIALTLLMLSIGGIVIRRRRMFN